MRAFGFTMSRVVGSGLVLAGLVFSSLAVADGVDVGGGAPSRVVAGNEVGHGVCGQDGNGSPASRNVAGGQDSGGSPVLSIGNDGGGGALAGAEIGSGFVPENVGNGVPGSDAGGGFNAESTGAGNRVRAV